MGKKKQALNPKQMQTKLNKIITYLSEIGDVADISFTASHRIPRGNPEEILPRRRDEIEVIIEDMDRFGTSKVKEEELLRLIDLHEAVLYQELDTLTQFKGIAERIKQVAPELTDIVDKNIEAAEQRILRRR